MKKKKVVSQETRAKISAAMKKKHASAKAQVAQELRLVRENVFMIEVDLEELEKRVVDRLIKRLGRNG